MKELSIVKKSQRYDEIIEKAKSLLGCNQLGDAWIYKLLPELRESEDEKIRKELLQIAKESEDSFYMVMTPNKKEKLIAWLEKQGEQKDILEDAILDSNEDGLIAETIRYKNEKQDNKVEPKFHEGDWIVFYELTLCVKRVVKGFYITTSKDGITKGYDWSIDNVARLWTIEDANNGDILATSDYILIFEKLLPKNGGVSYCHYDFGCSTPQFDFNKDNNWYFGKEAKVYPATKEQRNVLIKAMVDAGYTFDFEKKELRKIGDIQFPSEKITIEEEIVNLSHMNLDPEENATEIELWKQYFLSESIKEWKLDEWNKDDEAKLQSVLFHIEDVENKDVIDWLKSLKDRLQPKVEWSKEDKCNLSDIEAMIHTMKGDGLNADRLINWLKSLRPHQWKPSEEQLKSLKNVIEVGYFTSYPNSLETLYEQLKNL